MLEKQGSSTDKLSAAIVIVLIMPIYIYIKYVFIYVWIYMSAYTHNYGVYLFQCIPFTYSRTGKTFAG